MGDTGLHVEVVRAVYDLMRRLNTGKQDLLYFPINAPRKTSDFWYV